MDCTPSSRRTSHHAFSRGGLPDDDDAALSLLSPHGATPLAPRERKSGYRRNSDDSPGGRFSSGEDMVLTVKVFDDFDTPFRKRQRPSDHDHDDHDGDHSGHLQISSFFDDRFPSRRDLQNPLFSDHEDEDEDEDEGLLSPSRSRPSPGKMTSEAPTLNDRKSTLHFSDVMSPVRPPPANPGGGLAADISDSASGCLPFELNCEACGRTYLTKQHLATHDCRGRPHRRPESLARIAALDDNEVDHVISQFLDSTISVKSDVFAPLQKRSHDSYPPLLPSPPLTNSSPLTPALHSLDSSGNFAFREDCHFRCGRSFASSERLHVHMKTCPVSRNFSVAPLDASVESNHARKFPCMYCGRIFEYLSGHQAHEPVCLRVFGGTKNPQKLTKYSPKPTSPTNPRPRQAGESFRALTTSLAVPPIPEREEVMSLSSLRSSLKQLKATAGGRSQRREVALSPVRWSEENVPDAMLVREYDASRYCSTSSTLTTSSSSLESSLELKYEKLKEKIRAINTKLRIG